MTIVYISHKLDEVERITDEVIVMRDGRFVARDATADLTRHQMANLMVGRELVGPVPAARPARRGDAGAPLLKVRGLTVPGWAEDVSFEVRAGEILGFAGLVGAGRTELFEGLLGLRPHARAAHRARPAARCASATRARPRDQGLTYLSEDRKGKGLHVAFGLRENLTLMDAGALREALAAAAARSARRCSGAVARLRHPHRLADAARVVAVGRQPAEARAGQGAAAASRAWSCSTSRRAASTSAPSATSIS